MGAERTLSHESLTFLIAGLLIIVGFSVWGYLVAQGLKTLRRETAPAGAGRGLMTVLGDAEFRALHRNHLHFADVCLFGAGAVMVSAYLGH